MQTQPEIIIKPPEKSLCLSQRELFNYVNGNFSEKEKRKIESHLLVCLNCISHYEEVLNKKESADINGKYADLFPDAGKKKFEINFISKRKLFTAAAILFGMIVIYGAYSKFTSGPEKIGTSRSNISEPQKAIPEPVNKQEPVSSETNNIEEVIQPPTGNEAGITVEPKEQNPPAEIKVAEKKIDEAAENKNIPLTEELQKPVEKINSAPVLKDELPAQDNTEKLPEAPVASFIKNYKVSKSPDEPETGSYAKQLETIFREIDQSDYSNALTETGKLLFDHPDDVNGRYYKGFIHYQAQDNERALVEMDWILNKHDKIFYNDARWYKALILNRTQKQDEAKKILAELASKNGSYSAKAKQLLELMGEK